MDDPVRDSYDRVAGEYARRLLDELDSKPLDRALLAAFAEVAPPGPVADLGCGPGHVGRHLHRLGREVIGIDLSAGMVETARRLCPGPEYRVGTMLELDLADGCLGGAIAFYSIIHLTPGQLPAAFAELRRALRPEGAALLAFHTPPRTSAGGFEGGSVFHTGSQVVHLDSWWDLPVSLDFHFHPPDTIRHLLEQAGLAVEWDLRRQPTASEVQTQRCYLLARAPSPSGRRSGAC